jgi:hypothetical protein
MRRLLKENGLSLFFLALFLIVLALQAIAGHAAYNNEQLDHGAEAISLARYVTTSEFGNAVMENWQSEYLQFSIFILATVWLVQKGSTESKELDQVGPESDKDQAIGEHAHSNSPAWAKVTGVRLWLYSNSLLFVMGTIFFASWFAQSVTGWSAYNDDQVLHRAAEVSWFGYVTGAEFWEATLQNWQSEFLAVGTMAIFSVYLRQRGSAQSKPVGCPHDKTAVEG